VWVATPAAIGDPSYFGAGSHDVVVLCIGPSTASGLEIYRQLRQLDARVPVIFVADTGRADAAIEAIKQGAYDVLFRPVDPAALQRVVAEALDVGRRTQRPVAAADVEGAVEGNLPLVGCCPAMREVYKAVGRVAAHNMPVLITGESGTGKELVARAIHEHSHRSDKPFMAINCAAIPESLLESELFGHERGAFTGADRRRIGRFEQCDGGTILLDEIGDMPPSLQAKMLRLLQEQAFERVGGNETIRTDVRVIAATHRDLKAWSQQGKFRPDLYYRLGVFTVHLPPLRDRGDDLPMLVHHYLRQFGRELNRDVREVLPEAMERLRAHAWPGNVRELQSVVKRALLRATGSVLIPAFLPELPSDASEPVETGGPGAGPAFRFEGFVRRRLEGGSTDLHAEVQLEIDRILLPTVLRFTNGNQNQASKVLGLARQTLRLRLRTIGLNVVKIFEEDPR
jgi:two-component system nitrogen regulation response regulator GlnG